MIRLNALLDVRDLARRLAGALRLAPLVVEVGLHGIVRVTEAQLPKSFSLENALA